MEYNISYNHPYFEELVFCNPHIPDFEELEEVYAHGCCFALAFYCYKNYKWPIYVVYIETKNKSPQVIHVITKSDSHTYFDVYGYQNKDQVIEKWYKQEEKIQILSIKDVEVE